MALLLASLLPLPALGGSDPVGTVVLGSDKKAPAALAGLKKGLKDIGTKLRPTREMRATAGAPVKALAAACAGRSACFDGIAKSVESEIWLVDIVRGQYVSQVVLHRGIPGGGGKSAQLTIFSDTEVEAAAYGLATEAGGLDAKGTLDVVSIPEGADVRVAGQLVGQTPVMGFSVKAGAVRVSIEAKGFEDVSQLVALRPEGHEKIERILEVKLDEIPLADLDDLGMGLDDPGTETGTPTGETGTATTDEGGETVATNVGDLSPGEAARVALPPLNTTPIEPARKGIRLPTWVAMGLGMAAVGGGAYFGVDAGSQARSASSEPVQLHVQQFNDSARSSAMKANVFYGVGAAALGTATYLLIRDLSR